MASGNFFTRKENIYVEEQGISGLLWSYRMRRPHKTISWRLVECEFFVTFDLWVDCLQFLLCEMGTGDIERCLRQVRGESGSKEGGRGRGKKDGVKPLLPWLVRSQCDFTDLEIGKRSAKPFPAICRDLAPGILLQWLGSSHKGLFLKSFLALGEWLVFNLENRYLTVTVSI